MKIGKKEGKKRPEGLLCKQRPEETEPGAGGGVMGQSYWEKKPFREMIRGAMEHSLCYGVYENRTIWWDTQG